MELNTRPLIYIAGPITNGGTVPAGDAKQRFEAAKLEVVQLGYRAITPMEICWPKLGQEANKETWPEFMKLNIRSLLECDGIYLLRGWEDSRGARLEKLIADGLEMTVLYQTPLDAIIDHVNKHSREHNQ